MISKFIKKKLAEGILKDTGLAVEMLSEVFKLDKDKVVELLKDYIN